MPVVQLERFDLGKCSGVFHECEMARSVNVRYNQC